MPGQQRHAQGPRHFLRQHGLAGARLPLDQQGPLQGHGRVDGHFQIVSHNILVGAFELFHSLCLVENLAARARFHIQKQWLEDKINPVKRAFESGGSINVGSGAHNRGGRDQAFSRV